MTDLLYRLSRGFMLVKMGMFDFEFQFCKFSVLTILLYQSVKGLLVYEIRKSMFLK